MKNQEYIVSTAMLAAYLGKKSSDCLDLMTPFVLYLLPDEGCKIDQSEISIRLKEDFGFNNVPENVIAKILNRINRRDSYIKKEAGSYYVIKNYDRLTFEQNRRIITTKIEEISKKLVFFLKEKSFNLFVTEDMAKEYIEIFLGSYNYIYDEIEKYKRITVSSSDAKSNFWVARFLLDAYEKESTVFDDFLEIIKGSLASRAITFWSEEKTEHSKKLQNTIFYFDTRLLINCLGIGSEEEQRATTELKELIEANGGAVHTFQHYIEELHGILTKYIKSPADRTGLSLDFFRNGQFSSEYVRMYRDSLQSYLEKINIFVDEKPNCSEPLSALDWPIDILDLKSTLAKYVKYGSDDKGEEQIKNDVQTLESISILRYNQKGKSSLEDCKAIFVTQNADITYAVHKYFINNKEKRGIGLAVSEVELTAWLWLNYSKNSNELPKLKLLENAYTACCPTEAVINEFSRIVIAMSEKGMITSEQAQVIRRGNIDLSSLVDKTNNDSSEINEDDVQNLVDSYLGGIEKKVKKGFQKEYYKLGKEKKEFQEEQDKQLKQLEKREKDISSKEKYVEILEEQQKHRAANYKNSVIQGLMKKADDDAKRDQRRFLILGNLTVALVFGVMIICSIIGFWNTVSLDGIMNKAGVAASVFFSVLGLAGVFDVIVKVKKGGIKIIYFMSTKLYERKYEKYINENTKYIPQ